MCSFADHPRGSPNGACPSKGSSRSPASVADFRRLVAIAIIRRAQLYL